MNDDADPLGLAHLADYLPTYAQGRNPLDNPVGDASARLAGGHPGNFEALAERYLPHSPLASVAPQGGPPVRGFAGGGEVGIAERLARFIAGLGERLRPTVTSTAEEAPVAVHTLEQPSAQERLRRTGSQLNPASGVDPYNTADELARRLETEDLLSSALSTTPDSMLLQPGFMSRPQAYAGGGDVADSSVRELADFARGDPTDANADNRARVATNLASLFYGLDDKGQPALGGRAWTATQGGTPMGALDAITATPHNLVQLGALLDKYLPGQSNPKFWESIDPQWSAEAAARLAQLKQKMQQSAGLKDDGSLTTAALDAVSDPSMVAPLGIARIASEGSAARNLLNTAAGGSDSSNPQPQGAH